MGADSVESLAPVFTLITEKDNAVLARTNVKPGKYKYTIIGRDPFGKTLFESAEKRMEITEGHFLGTFQGSDYSVRA